ncbi:MIF4G domain-containing protein isoform 3-T4 [Dugong dugon]
MVMGEPSREEYKIQSFEAETQQLLKTALKDPGAVDLDKVANVIVDHSLQDCVFSKEAGRMCYAIIQAESKQAGQSVFRRGLLNRLQQEYQAREQLRARSLQGWVCYVTFICNIFDYLRVNNMPMMALVNPVYDCLFRLAQADSLSKEEEDPPGGMRVKPDSMKGTARTWCSASTVLGCPVECTALLGSHLPLPCRWTAWCCSCTGSGSSWRR